MSDQELSSVQTEEELSTPECSPQSSLEPEEDIELEDEPSVDPDAEIDLDELAEADEALWNDEHTSDVEPEYIPDQESEDEDFEPEDEDETATEDMCTQHDFCVDVAREVDKLVAKVMERRSDVKVCIATLAESICDLYEVVNEEAE